MKWVKWIWLSVMCLAATICFREVYPETTAGDLSFLGLVIGTFPSGLVAVFCISELTKALPLSNPIKWEEVIGLPAMVLAGYVQWFVLGPILVKRFRSKYHKRFEGLSLRQRRFMKITSVVLIFSLAISVVGFVVHRIYLKKTYGDPMHEAHKLMEEMHYAEAREKLEPIASSYWPAAFNLALLYGSGLGVEFSREKTIELLKAGIAMKESKDFPKPCSPEVSDLAVDVKYLALELDRIAIVKKHDWHKEAVDLGYDPRKCSKPIE